MKYVAIDTSTLTGCSEEEISEIMDYFTKYEVEVIDESFESLEDKGMVSEYNDIEGILLTITGIEENTSNKIVI
ncbi:MAG: hypothetical protein PF505_08430, partial [Vallitaleaceae bacterium]|nr:hypothetical protein [Vallitaleaceae bacterium]